MPTTQLEGIEAGAPGAVTETPPGLRGAQDLAKGAARPTAAAVAVGRAIGVPVPARGSVAASKPPTVDGAAAASTVPLPPAPQPCASAPSTSPGETEHADSATAVGRPMGRTMVVPDVKALAWRWSGFRVWTGSGSGRSAALGSDASPLRSACVRLLERDVEFCKGVK